MAFQKHCPGCFENKDGAAVCPHCGYDETAPRSMRYLPHGLVLHNTYRVGRVLGRPGGFGVTYLGWDLRLHQRVAIKEFFPRDAVDRDTRGIGVRPNSEQEAPAFEAAKLRFLQEARLVARLDHPNIVRVHNFFDEHGTAYLVMRYYRGQVLSEYLSGDRSILEPDPALALMLPVLDGLQSVHDSGLIHRDIKPGNIYLTREGTPIVLDFGAARQTAGELVSTVSLVLTESYAPLEQYRRSSQGPWTDVYGAAATLYRMLTGHPPPSVLDRLGSDPLDESGFSEIPPDLRGVLSRALAVRAEDRYQSAAEFKAALRQPDTAVFLPPPITAAPYTQPPSREVTRELTQEVTTRPVSPLLEEPPTRPAPLLPPAAPAPAPAVANTAAPAGGLLRTALLAGVMLMLGAVAALQWSARVPQAPVSSTRPDALSIHPALAEIPAGGFLMGDPGRRGRSNEAPPQPRTMPAFSISASEVTVGQFRRFVEDRGYVNPLWPLFPCERSPLRDADWEQPGYDQTEAHPVVCISQRDARAYAEWLSAQTGQRYRLPTEAEFEYAMRGGGQTQYWWGDQIDFSRALCSVCREPAPLQPSPVMSLGANRYGLYDTAGNVREWTCSAYGPMDSAAPQECAGEHAGLVTVRAGSWREPPTSLRSAHRTYLHPDQRDDYTGFRVVRLP